VSVCALRSAKVLRGWGPVSLGAQSSSRRELPAAVAWEQWAAYTSVRDSAFISSSPSFTSSLSLPLLPAAAKGKSGFILPLGLVYAAMATLGFSAEMYREKIMPDSLAVVGV